MFSMSYFIQVMIFKFSNQYQKLKYVLKETKYLFIVYYNTYVVLLSNRVRTKPLGISNIDFPSAAFPE